MTRKNAFKIRHLWLHFLIGLTVSISNNFFFRQRMFPRFSVDLVFILPYTFSEVVLVYFFVRVSGNAISGSLSFSNFIRHGLTECKQCCLR
jgi:hypothetical protein